MTTPRQFIVFSLDDQFRPREGIMIAGMIHVEMGTNQDVNIVRAQAQIGQVLNYISRILGGLRVIWRQPAINQDMLVIASFDEVANANHRQGSAFS
jgi:hypothetical protein